MNGLSKEQRIAKHKEFLQSNWHLVAAFSWENYLAQGRGAVLVPEEDFLHVGHPKLKGVRFRYLPLTERDKTPFEEVLAEKELAWLESYDPDDKVIVCVLREGEGVSSYLIGGRTRPSEAHARQTQLPLDHTQK